MTDRAAPMSSEEEARSRLEYWLVIDQAALEALDDYKTAIERRVLAQQPCYHNECQGHAEPGCYIGLNCPCGPCTARQTQETSG